MPYRLLADLVVILHLAFVVFALFGVLLALRWKRIVWLQAPAALWAAAIEFGGWICPLTPLEVWLREQAGGTGYRSGFIEYYLLPVLYPAGLTREAQFVLGAAVLAVNIATYAWLWRRWRENL
ncbi:MAG: DUF2784 domain-containing protein [Candidatus Methylomirabilaceae bacterium]